MKFKTSLAFVLGMVCLLAIAATRAPFYAAAPTQVIPFTVVAVADGTVTNTFSTAFSSAPRVVLTQWAAVHSPTNLIVSVTTSNVIIRTGQVGITNFGIAIGTP